MGVGLSDGSYMEDYTTMVAMSIPKGLTRVPVYKSDPEVIVPPDVDRGMEVSPDKVEGDKVVNDIILDPRNKIGLDVSFKRPPQATEKPTDALKPEEGSQVPGNGENTEIRPEPYGLNPPEGNAIQSYVKGREQAIRDLPQTIRDIPENFRKDMEARSNMTDEQRIEEAINVAGSFGTGTMIGVKARVFDKNALAQAQIMAADGVHPDVILSKTGTFKGVDGRWRQELDDSTAKFKSDWANPIKGAEEAFKKEGIALDTTYGPGGKNNIYSLRKWKSDEKIRPEDLPGDLFIKWGELNQGQFSTKLSEILDQPELFKAYPQLKDVKVRFDPKNKSAHWDVTNNEIVIGEHFKADKGTLYHEIQHAVQDIEGFAKGTHPAKAITEFKLKLQDDIRPVVDRLKELYEAGKKRNLDEHESAEKAHLSFLVRKFNEYYKAADEESVKFYMKSAGETEARNVDTRVLLNAKERRNMPPWATQDLPSSQQIPVMDPNRSTAYGIKNDKTGEIVKAPDKPANFRRSANDNKTYKELSDELDKLSSKERLTDDEFQRLLDLNKILTGLEKNPK